MDLAHLLYLGSCHDRQRCPPFCLLSMLGMPWVFPRPDRKHNRPSLFWFCPEVFVFPAGQKCLLPGAISNYLICLFSTQRSCGSVWRSLWMSELCSLFPRMTTRCPAKETFSYFRVDRLVKQVPPILANFCLHLIGQATSQTDYCSGPYTFF